MKICLVKDGKRKTVIVTENNEYFFSTEIVYKARLVAGMEISSSDFFALKDESDKLLAKHYLFTLLSKQLKSKLQAERKLKEKGYYSKAIEYAIDKAEEYKLLDDENYAQSYINTYIRNKGSKLIKYELKKAGIADNIIDRFLEGREDEVLLTAKNCAQNFLRIKGKNANRDKLYRHLLNKGFDYGTIKCAISDVLAESEDYE